MARGTLPGSRHTRSTTDVPCLPPTCEPGRHSRRHPIDNGGSMTIETLASCTHSQPDLLGQTVVVIGGSSGIGLETARQARTLGAEVILAGRNAGRVQRAGLKLKALNTA